VTVPRGRSWDSDGCFALDYLRSEQAGEPRRALVHALKSGEVRAVNRAAHLMAIALISSRQPRFPNSGFLLIATPGHLAGPPTSALEGLCSRIAALIPGVAHRPAALWRTSSLRQSSTSNIRPSVREHLETLTATDHLAGRSVILIDDVFTFGRVTEASRTRLAEAGARKVIVACLARTLL
jgi:phosphoribosylpyrophosphate synthetase